MNPDEGRTHRQEADMAGAQQRVVVRRMTEMGSSQWGIYVDGVLAEGGFFSLQRAETVAGEYRYRAAVRDAGNQAHAEAAEKFGPVTATNVGDFLTFQENRMRDHLDTARQADLAECGVCGRNTRVYCDDTPVGAVCAECHDHRKGGAA